MKSHSHRRGWWSVFALSLAACVQNRAALEAAELAERAHLEELKAVADTLNDRRREMDALDARLQAVLDGRAIEVTPLPPPPRPTVPAAPAVTLPPVGFFEGAEGARLRERIAETQRRSAELEKVIAAVNHIDARRAEVEAKLKVLEALRAGQDAGAIER